MSGTPHFFLPVSVLNELMVVSAQRNLDNSISKDIVAPPGGKTICRI